MESKHPEIKKLHKIRLERARQLLEKETPTCSQVGTDLALVPVVPRGVPLRPRAGSQGFMMLQHCWNCGSADHKLSTCPTKPEALQLVALEKKMRAIVASQNKQETHLRTHFKYVQLVQKSAAYSARKAQRTSVVEARCQIDLIRASPKEFCRMCIGDGLLHDLEGAPCFSDKCKADAGEEGVLGPMSDSNSSGIRDVTRDSVWYRCTVCQRKRRVISVSLLFRPVGGNVKSMSYAVLSMWNCVEGASITYTCKQLNLPKKIVMKYFKMARKIMAWDAERRQSQFVFGCLPDGHTADVEADEACFF